MTRRSGMTMLEIVAATSILAVVTSIAAQAIALSFRHTAYQQDYSIALREATNVMAVAQQLPADQFGSQELLRTCDELGIIDRLKRDAMTLDISLTDKDAPASSRTATSGEIATTQVIATVSWQRRLRPHQVRLVTWRFTSPGSSPAP